MASVARRGNPQDLADRLDPEGVAMLRLPALVAALQSEDAHEGVRTFQEKRKPRWSGR
ncbi:hypothetical protein BN2475_120072 [Paraburkholderia ribeironis]|uniref:Enoyl-CoA hydratase n=1 Tax=Paraburkholderia ribeironis TaxID=1247936 RepID=A0A1N7RR17_9BURK|nr:hypothetical protein [Paraburkholderia ribeironis]SIT37516.1 hypothetical protein BN2475_120072 [Paraburkholderia ribeironis]